MWTGNERTAAIWLRPLVIFQRCCCCASLPVNLHMCTCKTMCQKTTGHFWSDEETNPKSNGTKTHQCETRCFTKNTNFESFVTTSVCFQPQNLIIGLGFKWFWSITVIWLLTFLCTCKNGPPPSSLKVYMDKTTKHPPWQHMQALTTTGNRSLLVPVIPGPALMAEPHTNTHRKQCWRSWAFVLTSFSDPATKSHRTCCHKGKMEG